MIPICQTLNKRIEIDNSKHDSTGFATKITSISHQPPEGSANAQFDKTQFFLRHPVVIDENSSISTACTQCQKYCKVWKAGQKSCKLWASQKSAWKASQKSYSRFKLPDRQILDFAITLEKCQSFLLLMASWRTSYTAWKSEICKIFHLQKESRQYCHLSICRCFGWVRQIESDNKTRISSLVFLRTLK